MSLNNNEIENIIEYLKQNNSETTWIEVKENKIKQKLINQEKQYQQLQIRVYQMIKIMDILLQELKIKLGKFLELQIDYLNII